MPVSLEQVSRRRFLQRSLAIGAIGLLPRRILAAAEPIDQERIALLSDVHVSSSGESVMAERLNTAVSQVLALPQRPDKVLVAGDCAHLKGKAGDYREYVRCIQPLVGAALPMYMTLGNHDNREEFWAALPGEQAEINSQLRRQSMVVPGRHANWFMLDSLNKTNSGPGELGSDQLAWLAAELDHHAEKPAIVLLHHNPDRDADSGSLRDSDQLLAITRGRRNVKAMFFGHTHVWEVTQDRSGIHMVNLPATGYTLWMRSFIGWVDCTLHARGATLQMHTIQDRKENGQIVRLPWRPA